MPIKAALQFTSWSYSRYMAYQECPLAARLKHLEKKGDNRKSAAMQRGTDIHKLAELHLNGQLKKLPDELKLFADEYKVLRKLPTQTEHQWAHKRDWSPTEWFGKEAWFRFIADASAAVRETLKKKILRVVRVIDFKTGKIRPGYDDQLELGAISAFNQYDDVDVVNGELWYLDQGELKDTRFERADLADLQKKWEKKTMAMLNDTTHAPRPGAGCRWCEFSKARGGPCAY